MIFGSLNNLLHKIKHKAKTAQKEKEKHYAASGREIGLQAGPLPLGPRARRARSLPLTRSLTGGSRSSGSSCSPLCETLTGRSHPSASPPSRTVARPRLRPPVARVLAYARVRTSTASILRLHSYYWRTLYSLLLTSVACMADGHGGHP